MRWLVIGIVCMFFLALLGSLLVLGLLSVDWRRVGRWFQTHVLGRSDIWFEGSRYMRRWLFGPKSWPGLRVHCIERSDMDRELHDHPFSFVTLILSGGYWEHTADGERKWHGPGSVLFRSAEVLHRIELETKCPSDRQGPCDPEFCPQNKAWTVVIRGPYRRPWGFLAEDGWTGWRAFTAEREGKGSAAGEYATASSI